MNGTLHSMILKRKSFHPFQGIPYPLPLHPDNGGEEERIIWATLALLRLVTNGSREVERIKERLLH